MIEEKKRRLREAGIIFMETAVPHIVEMVDSFGGPEMVDLRDDVDACFDYMWRVLADGCYDTVTDAFLASYHNGG